MAVVTKEILFLGWNQAQLEAELEKMRLKIQRDGSDFKSSYSAGGQSVSKQERMPLTEYMRRLSNALAEVAPAKWGVAKTSRSFFADFRGNE